MHRVYEKNHGETGRVEGGWDVVHTGGRGSTGIGRNSVGNNLHCPHTEGGGTVGGAVANI